LVETAGVAREPLWSHAGFGLPLAARRDYTGAKRKPKGAGAARLIPDMLFMFDCDGVLVDSEIIAAVVDAEHLAEVGFKITPEEVIRRFAGLTSVDIVEVIEAEIGRPLSPEFLKGQKAELDVRLQNEVEPVTGVHEMLDMIDGQVCVCSNSSMERLRMTMGRTRLWDRFRPYVYSAPEVGTKKPKPDPNVYRYALEQFQCDPRDAVVIEDSVFGVTAAKAAGARVIGFTGASHAWPGLADLLTEAGAETVVNRLTDVPKVAEAFAMWDGVGD
jgi:HAD superfamily hydrolase (TIGR01509 family)